MSLQHSAHKKIDLTNKDALFLADPVRLKSVECRFGTSGSISEAHFDSSRNMASVVSGMRRWILAPALLQARLPASVGPRLCAAVKSGLGPA